MEIPSARRLAELPQAVVAAPVQRQWGARSRVMFIALYLLILCVAVAAVAHFFRERPMDLSHRTAWQNWQLWKNLTAGQLSPDATEVIKHDLAAQERNRQIDNVNLGVLAVAGVALLILIVGYFLPRKINVNSR